MGLLFLSFNTQMLTMYNTMDVNFAVLDTVISAVMGAVLGAACGFGLGRFSN
jgi:NhaP-type Na+/H+ or K+/H+ antiporter